MSHYFKNEVKTIYFKWLCDLVGFDNNYSILARALHRKDFYSLVDNDNNRAEDGKNIRDLFIRTKEVDLEYSEDELEYALGGPCSVLEMLIALSFRMEDTLYECDSTNKSNEYFWQMLRNLGVDTFTNEEFTEEEVYIVDEILNDFLERKYKRDGNGGLFPLKNSTKDQRKVEIWYQMMSYLTENYTI